MGNIERDNPVFKAVIGWLHYFPRVELTEREERKLWEEWMEPALAELDQGAVSDIETAVRLLDDAVTTIIDTDLRREWEAERARLRAAHEE